MAKKSHTFKGQAKPYGQSGHFHEPMRHSLQARGIKTGNLSASRMKLQKAYLKAGYDLNKKVSFWGEDMPLKEAIQKMDKGDIRDGYKQIRYNKAVEEINKKVVLRDTDGDGVSDAEDCDPLDPTKQDENKIRGSSGEQTHMRVMWGNKDELVSFLDSKGYSWIYGEPSDGSIIILSGDTDKLVDFLKANKYTWTNAEPSNKSIHLDRLIDRERNLRDGIKRKVMGIGDYILDKEGHTTIYFVEEDGNFKWVLNPKQSDNVFCERKAKLFRKDIY